MTAKTLEQIAEECACRLSGGPAWQLLADSKIQIIKSEIEREKLLVLAAINEALTQERERTCECWRFDIVPDAYCGNCGGKIVVKEAKQ